jgi:hypothetical protein
MNEPSKPFEAIVGEKLSAITFVLDYWQLQFDGLTINALSRLEVSAGVQPEAFTITFEDRSSIKISLRWEDYRGPEAMMFYGYDLSTWTVVRADR